MSFWDIRCAMCGQLYDPDQHLACQTCPLHSGCNLVCCPSCGYQTVNPHRSKLVRLLHSFHTHRMATRFSNSGMNRITLAEVPVGCEAKVVGFSADIPLGRRIYLQAYGLVPSHRIQVLQQSSVTIIRLDHVELALEKDLAKRIRVRMTLNGQKDQSPVSSMH